MCCFPGLTKTGIFFSMPTTLSEWTAFLGEHPLPAMAATLRKVTQLLESPRASNVDFQQLIRRDPGRRILVVVNVRHCHHIRPDLRKYPGIDVVRFSEL